jgi:multiple antibiotic resistance protein
LEILKTIVGAFLVTFAALFPIVNPLEAAPLYHVLTRDLPESVQAGLTRKVAINSFGLLLGSMVLGPWVLVLFGIEAPVLRIAGGLVLTALGWKLLTQEQWSDHAASEVPHDAMERAGAFYPLTMPLTVGPGSMSVAVSIGSRKPLGVAGLAETALHAIGACAGLAAIALSIFVAYRFSGYLSRILGKSGVEVLVRLSAFIVMCIGIEFLWSGYLALAASRAP